MYGDPNLPIRTAPSHLERDNERLRTRVDELRLRNAELLDEVIALRRVNQTLVESFPQPEVRS